MHRIEDLIGADFCFYLSFSKIVPAETLSKFKHNLVVHESDLPAGRGWSPLSWQILEGRKEIAIVMFEANDEVDGGSIYFRDLMKFDGSELVDELRGIQADATLKLCDEFIKNYPTLKGAVKQSGESTFYARRSPADSQLDSDKSLREQFNLIRIADNASYPVYFEIDGNFYELWVTKKGVLNSDL